MTDYERGRLAGFAEGVEATVMTENWLRKALDAVLADDSGDVDFIKWAARQALEAIPALRAPSPVTYRGRCPEGIPGCMCQEDADPDPAPSPKEDAPRCEACGGRGRAPGDVPANGFPRACRAHRGTGRSTTGGGK